MWIESDWNVENGFEESEFEVLLLRLDFRVAIADSEKRKTRTQRGGDAVVEFPLDSGGGGGWERSRGTRVLRDLVRSWKGGTETVQVAPEEISAHELMKCHVEVPSRTAWLNAKPSATPSLSLVICLMMMHQQGESFHLEGHRCQEGSSALPILFVPASNCSSTDTMRNIHSCEDVDFQIGPYMILELNLAGISLFKRYSMDHVSPSIQSFFPTIELARWNGFKLKPLK
ncbi:hypothetical protein AKJ16_DCAP04806 [Drosera capensis]